MLMIGALAVISGDLNDRFDIRCLQLLLSFKSKCYSAANATEWPDDVVHDGRLHRQVNVYRQGSLLSV